MYCIPATLNAVCDAFVGPLLSVIEAVVTALGHTLQEHCFKACASPIPPSPCCCLCADPGLLSFHCHLALGGLRGTLDHPGNPAGGHCVSTQEACRGQGTESVRQSHRRGCKLSSRWEGKPCLRHSVSPICRCGQQVSLSWLPCDLFVAHLSGY